MNPSYDNTGMPAYVLDVASEYSGNGPVGLGLTGRAGAGKTTFLGEISREAETRGLHVSPYEVDWNFKLSSSERAAWITEGIQVGRAEYAKRANQLTWWDFAKVAENVALLKKGGVMEMSDAYNKKSGAKDKYVKLGPVPEDGLLIVENCFVADPAISDNLDVVAYVFVRPDKGFLNTWARDGHRKPWFPYVQRYMETTWSEDAYMGEHMGAIEEKMLVIDNTNPHERQVLHEPGSKLSDELREQIVPGFAQLAIPLEHIVEWPKT